MSRLFQRLNGGFTLVDQRDDKHGHPEMKVIGVFSYIGKLAPDEISFIRSYYNLTHKGFSCVAREKYPVKVNASMYGSFLVFERTLGDKIRKRREELCLTQDALAKRLGWADSRIGVYERGESIPSSYSAERLTEALELPDGEVERWLE